MVNQTYTSNGRNQYTQIAGTNGGTLGWDLNGNLTSDGFTTFGYDTENRLTSATGAKTATLTYDPMGRLQQVSNAAGTTRFFYDGDRLILEYNGSGAIQRRYVHGAGVDEPIVWHEGAGVSWTSRRYLHADHQGSIINVTNAAGSTLIVGAYDAYGVTATNTGRFQYTGQTAITQVGLYYYKARFYNPGLGRFMQTDPIGYDDDVNLYAYVGNDPLNNADPSGEACVPCVTAGIGAAYRGGREGIRQYKADKFEPAKLLSETMKGAAVGFGAGAGGSAALMVKAADAFTVAVGTATGAAAADFTLSQPIDVMTGQKSVGEVRMGAGDVIGALATGLEEMIGGPAGDAAGEVYDLARSAVSVMGGGREVRNTVGTQVTSAVAGNAAGEAALAPVKSSCPDTHGCK